MPQPQDDIIPDDDLFWCARCDMFKPLAQKSPVTNHMGMLFCRTCANDMRQAGIKQWPQPENPSHE